MSSPSELFAGRYRILSKLGEGGMGTVFLGDDTLLQRKVAIKIPHPNISHNAGVVDRFLREAQMAAQINHPNFCRVYDVGIVNGRYFLTMDYIEGTPLSKLISRDKLWPIRDAVDLVRQLALALQVLHERGIIHRDLKPSNVMMHKDGLPILMDFGLARPAAKVTTLSTNPLGTPAYMAPEQINAAQGDVGPASDIYGLGVILFQLLTGRLPFRGTMMEVFSQILQDTPPVPSSLRVDIDPWLDQLCLQTMAKTPLQRPASMEELAALLHQYLACYHGGVVEPQGKKSSGLSMSRNPTPFPPLDRSLTPSRPTLPPFDPTMMSPPQPDPTLIAVPIVPDPTMLAPRPALPVEGGETPVTPIPREPTVADPPSSLAMLLQNKQPDPPQKPIPPPGTTVLVPGLAINAPPPGDLDRPNPTLTQYTLAHGPIAAPGQPVPAQQLPPPPVVRLETTLVKRPRVRVGMIGLVLLGLAITAGVTVLAATTDWNAVETWWAMLWTRTTSTPTATGSTPTTHRGGAVRVDWLAKPPDKIKVRPGGSTAFLIGVAGDEVAGSLKLKATAEHPLPPPLVSIPSRVASQGPDRGEAGEQAITVEFGAVPAWDTKEIPVAIHVGSGVRRGTYTLVVSANTNTSSTIEAIVELTVDGIELPRELVTSPKMVRIPAGFFWMGDPDSDKKATTNAPHHRVVLSDPFYMSETEVTEQQYAAIIEKAKVSEAEHPKRGISWELARDYAKTLNDKHPSSIGRYRLPWEVEWEYACRAGKEGTSFAYGPKLEPTQAVFRPSSMNSVRPVREKREANAWGLYDMHGNVREWCGDPYYATAYHEWKKNGDRWPIRLPPDGPQDPKIEAASIRRVVRGGSCEEEATDCRSFLRTDFGQKSLIGPAGIRLVLIPG